MSLFQASGQKKECILLDNHFCRRRRCDSKLKDGLRSCSLWCQLRFITSKISWGNFHLKVVSSGFQLLCFYWILQFYILKSFGLTSLKMCWHSQAKWVICFEHCIWVPLQTLWALINPLWWWAKAVVSSKEVMGSIWMAVVLFILFSSSLFLFCFQRALH